MKQSLLSGRTSGLRPSERQRLDRLCHRRHPPGLVADLLTLQRLGMEARALKLPLTLLVDERGLSRMLCVGPLDCLDDPAHTGRKGPHRSRTDQGLRLLTCLPGARQLEPSDEEAIHALDLSRGLWLRFAATGSGGFWPAALYRSAVSEPQPWQCLQQGELAELCRQDLAPSEEFILPSEPTQGQEQVLLLMISGPDSSDNERQLAELEGLVRSAGSLTVGSISQRRCRSGAPTLWGEGKVREAAVMARRLGASLVVTDRELTPVQGRNLERGLGLPVIDRSELILDIFAQRAASGAGRLQVELAQLRYRLPRLTGRGQSLSRQGGGIGTRGPGETQLEKDRRAISRRIERLHRDVERLGAHRARLRQDRRDITRLALVGYTNAGKSSLLNALTRATPHQAVLAEDKLFATLDPTTRRIAIPAPRTGEISHVLLTDTVGFIRELPPQLLEAFRSTLEETLEADGLLVVIDLSDPAWPEQLLTVGAILDQLGAIAPRLAIGNQIDRCPAGELERARALVPEMLFVSACSGAGLQGLRHHLVNWPFTPCPGAGSESAQQRPRSQG